MDLLVISDILLLVAASLSVISVLYIVWHCALEKQYLMILILATVTVFVAGLTLLAIGTVFD